MMTYRLYGLDVSSAFPLECEEHPNRRPDITIRNDHVELPAMECSARTGMLFHTSEDTIYLHWDTIGSFRIRAGSEITAKPAPEVDYSVFSRTLIRSILAIALYQRRRFILHASAVVVDGEAVVFAGDSGYGKSTLASSLHAAGHHLLADDIVVIEIGDLSHTVYPGNQEFKLWPDSLRNMGEQEEKLDRVAPDMEKRLLPVTEGLHHEPAALRSIYMLDFGDSEKIEPFPSAQAAIELVRNTYGVTLLHEIRTTDFFQQVIRLARTVPIFRLERGRSLERFDRFFAMVRQDLASTPDGLLPRTN